ncbi:unnamed protein product [Schistocephalus solidus]|uniref:Guanylate cyclase domain-containing protein n=1 Tax=Schistocephalus solidus TaxID=70667 RepID=A0A183T548_SCHSO|nr:unnamed protein product [Schistocephalus solidus]
MSTEGVCLTESTMNVSLPPPADSPLPPDSFDTMCMLLKNDAAEEDRDSDEPLQPKVARSIALAILSRISRLLGDSIDSCLRRLLPTHTALLTSLSTTTPCLTTSPATQASDAVYDTLLVAWGQNSLANLRNANKQGFVNGIPVVSVIRPSSLALLEALASWPSDQARISLLESADTLMDDFLSSAAAGFYHLPWSLELLEPFQRLIGMILKEPGKENITPLHRGDDAAYVNALATSTVAKSDRRSGPYVGEITMPFIDQSNLLSPTQPTPGPIKCPASRVVNLERELIRQPPAPNFHFSSLEFVMLSTNCGRTKAELASNLSILLLFWFCFVCSQIGECYDYGQTIDLRSPENETARACKASDAACIGGSSDYTSSAVQLALLFLPPPTRFQLQLFVERASHIVASVERHILPEITMHYARPTTLAMWFAPRFFPPSQSDKHSAGHALLEFLLSHSRGLDLIRPPSCPLVGEFGSQTPLTYVGKKPSFHLSEGSHQELTGAQNSSCGVTDNDDDEDIVKINTHFGRLTTSVCGLRAAASQADLYQTCAGNSSLPICRRLNYGESYVFEAATPSDLTSYHSCPTAPDDSRSGVTAATSTVEGNGDASEGMVSYDVDQFLLLGTTAHLIRTLNYFINDRKLDPKLKMKYIKQFEETHSDVFWLRFGDRQTALAYYAQLQRRIDDQRSQGPSVMNRLARIFRRKAQARACSVPRGLSQ